MDSELAVLFLRHKLSTAEQNKLAAAGVESLSTLANLEADDLTELGIPFLKAKALIKDAAAPGRGQPPAAAAVPAVPVQAVRFLLANVLQNLDSLKTNFLYVGRLSFSCLLTVRVGNRSQNLHCTNWAGQGFCQTPRFFQNSVLTL